jgi:RimJ/RimL family protein N-acetyltransferase
MRSSLAELPVVETVRLHLAPLRDADAQAVWQLTDDPAITKHVDILPTPFTIAHAKYLIQAGNDDGRVGFVGAWDRQGGGLVGVVGTELQGEDEVEIGYWIGVAFQGRGYAVEAAGGVISALERTLPERHVVAECRPENKASWRVLEKLGFRSTGRPGRRAGRELLVLREMAVSDRT